MSLWFFHSSILASGTHARCCLLVSLSHAVNSTYRMWPCFFLLYNTLGTFDCGSARGGRGREGEKATGAGGNGRTGRPRFNWLDYALSVPVRGESFFARARLLLQLGQHVRDRWPLNVRLAILFFCREARPVGIFWFHPHKKKKTTKKTCNETFERITRRLCFRPLGRRNPVWTPARCLLGGAAVKQV